MGKPQRVDLSNVVSLSEVSKQPIGDHETGLDDAIVIAGDDHGDEAGDHDDDHGDGLEAIADDTILTFRQIGELLGEKPNTVCASYWKKIHQAHEGLETPSLRTNGGSPTGYAAKAIAEYLRMGKDYDAYRATLEQRFPASAQAVRAVPVQSAIARYEPGVVVTLAEQSLQRAEERKFQAVSDVLEALQEFKLQTQQIQQSSEQEVYEREFTAELNRLKEAKRLEMIQAQAREDARKLAQQYMEGNGG